MTEEGKTDTRSRRCAIFGGSFDPVHLGHIAMAQTARETCGLAGVVFVPCSVSPFKTSTVASGEQRRRMLEIAVTDAGMEWASVSDFELNRPAPSYSWETALHFSKNCPDVEWYWILGTDQWDQIDRWAKAEKLREWLRFLVFSRHGREVTDRPGWRHTVVPFEHPASSTAIRADFSGQGEWLPEGVRQYCEAGGIYGDNEGG